MKAVMCLLVTLTFMTINDVDGGWFYTNQDPCSCAIPSMVGSKRQTGQESGDGVSDKVLQVVNMMANCTALADDLALHGLPIATANQLLDTWDKDGDGKLRGSELDGFLKVIEMYNICERLQQNTRK